MGKIGMTELLLIFGIALLFFGSRLPSMGKSLGEGFRNFKKGLNPDENKSAEAELNLTPTAAPKNDQNQNVKIQIEAGDQNSQVEKNNIETGRKSA